MNSPSPSSDVRALLHEKLDAMLDECDLVMDNAAFGQILHDLDDFLFVEGRKFTKEVLEQKLQERIETTEATPKGKQCPHCKKKRKSNSKKGKP
jgi:protein involved in sex pheromone biosynthesis